MSRHLIRQVLILHQHPIGENHASLSLLSPDSGILSVLAHGIRSAKSSLRPRCQTYSLVKAWIFEDSQRGSLKLTDVEVISDYLGIRDNLHALYHTAACAEILSRTPLQAEDGWAFSLFLLYLERLDSILKTKVKDGSQIAIPGKIASATVQFLWRYLNHTGYQPDAARCMSTGAILAGDEAAWFSHSLGGFVTQNPGNQHQRWLPAGAMQYLRHSSRTDFTPACEVGVSAASRNAVLALLLDLVQDTLGLKLRSISGQDFLFFLP